MEKKIGIGLIGLGTVGTGVARIINSPKGRNPLVSHIEIKKISVKDLKKKRSIDIHSSMMTSNPLEVVKDPSIQIIVEVMGGIETAREIIMKSSKK